VRVAYATWNVWEKRLEMSAVEKLSRNPSLSSAMPIAEDHRREYKKKTLSLSNFHEDSAFFSISRKDREVVTRLDRFGADNRSSFVRYFER